MVLACASITAVKCAAQTACCQHLYPQGESQSFSSLFARVSKVNKWVQLSLLSNYCLSTVIQNVKFCAHPFRAVFVFCNFLVSSEHKSHYVLGACFHGEGHLGWKSWYAAWSSCPLGRTLQLCMHACSVLSNSFVTPMDCSPPVSSVRGIIWAGILEWVAISCSRRSSWPGDRTRVSCIGRWILYHWVSDITSICGLLIRFLTMSCLCPSYHLTVILSLCI